MDGPARLCLRYTGRELCSWASVQLGEGGMSCKVAPKEQACRGVRKGMFTTCGGPACLRGGMSKLKSNSMKTHLITARNSYVLSIFLLSQPETEELRGSWTEEGSWRSDNRLQTGCRKRSWGGFSVRGWSENKDLRGILLSKQEGGWENIGREHHLQYENPEACQRREGGWLLMEPLHLVARKDLRDRDRRGDSPLRILGEEYFC